MYEDSQQLSNDIRSFSEYVESIIDGVTALFIHYLAVRIDDELVLVQGRLFFETLWPPRDRSIFSTDSVVAGRLPLSEIYGTYQEVIDDVMNGFIKTYHGNIIFKSDQQGDYASSYSSLHQLGLDSQNRLAVLEIFGENIHDNLNVTHLDWELRASATPFDSINELMGEYRLGVIQAERSEFVLVVQPVAIIGRDAVVSGNVATVTILLSRGLETSNASIGLRVRGREAISDRLSIAGAEINWVPDAVGMRGTINLPVEEASVLQCIACYRGKAFHYWWISDPNATQNARRAVYETWDPNLTVLRDFVSGTGRGQSRDLEVGIAWLLWMLGFEVAHLGATAKTQDAADLIAVTPSRHFAVIECTTGTLGSDRKLPLLVDRAANVANQLRKSNNADSRVLPVIVTSKTREEVRADIEQAERLGVLIVTREDILRELDSTLFESDPDRFYFQAEQIVIELRSKYESEDD